MISLIPVGILITLAVFLQVLGKFRYSIGRIWLLAAVTSLSTWGFMIALRFLNPSGFTIENWLSLPVKSISLSFSYSPESWTFGFLAVTLLLAVILSDARYVETPGILNRISGSVLITAIGLLAIQSESWVSLALTWGILDAIEFIFLTIEGTNKDAHQRLIVLFLTKSLGTILMIGVMVNTQLQGNPTATIGIWLVILILVFLRSGVLVTRNLDERWKDNQRGFWMVLRMIPFLSLFSFMGIIDISLPTGKLLTSLTAILGFAFLFFGAFWYLSKNIFKGNPYWLSGSLLLSLICIFSGQPGLLKTVAIFAVIGGGGIYLYSYRFKKQNLFTLFLLIGLLGIPFTPTSPLRTLASGAENSVSLSLLIPALALFIGGITRHSFQKEKPQGNPEAWMKFVHNAALLLIIISPWITILFNFSEIRNSQQWWLAVVVAGLAIIAILPYLPAVSFLGRNLTFINTLRHSLYPVIHYMENENRFTWLVKVLTAVQSSLSALINMSIRVLEGDGGILWSFFFLVLLISLINSLGIR